MPDMYDPILRAATPVKKGHSGKSLPEPREPLSSQQAELVEARLQEARDAVLKFVTDPTLSHQYSQQSAWRTFVALADNKLVPECSLPTRVNHTSIVLRQIVEMVGFNRHGGRAFTGAIAKDHLVLEVRKAQTVNLLSNAGYALLLDYPHRNKQLDDRMQFMQDHSASSGKRMQDTATSLRELSYAPTRMPKTVPGQQNLFS